MSHHGRLACLLALIANMSGCATYRPDPPIPPDVLQKQMIADLTSPTLLGDYNHLPQANAADIAAKVACRNQILQELISLTDSNYGKFEENYYGSDANTNFWSDTLNLGLTGASSVTGTAVALHINLDKMAELRR